MKIQVVLFSIVFIVASSSLFQGEFLECLIEVIQNLDQLTDTPFTPIPTLRVVAAADANEDLRVSSSFFDGNYHSITPDRNYKPTRRDDVLNQLGKPLLAATSIPRTTSQPVLRQRQTKKPLKQIAKSMPAKWAQPIFVEPQAIEPPAPVVVTAKNQNVCRWISLQEMSSISFNTGEVIIRDGTDQPCYIITMRAYIKYNDEAYFPLDRYRPHPYRSYKIEFSEASEQTNVGAQRLLLNCSLPPETLAKNIATVSLMSVQRANRTFNEEITIQVSCGYLVLQLRGDGTYLSLEAISFYQDGNAAGTRTSAEEQRANLAPTMQSKHLVFTTEGQSGLSPLIVMPTFSRYICQNRIVLTGNNSVQLVVSRFELKRLTNEPVMQSQAVTPFLEGEATSGEQLQQQQQQQQQQLQDMRNTGRDTFVDTRLRRDARATTILYKNPVTAGKSFALRAST